MPLFTAFKAFFRPLNTDQYLVKNLLFLARFAVIGWVILSLSRGLLVGLYWDRVTEADGLWPILIGGLRIDVATLSMLIGIPALLLTWQQLVPTRGRLTSQFIRWWCWIGCLLLLFMEIITPSFITEFNARPNRLFFEFLMSPKEVSGMLFKGYWPVLMVVIMVLTLAAWKTRAWLSDQPHQRAGINGTSVLAMLGIVCVLTLGARSGFQHRPINPAMVAFGQDRLLNSLPLNSTYGLFYAMYQLKNEASAAKLYGSLNDQEMLKLIRGNMSEGAHFVDQDIPTLHRIKPVNAFSKKNLIVVVEESLGAQFVGSLGGKPLTPNIDHWSKKGWSFTRLYATGTRSARGLEAITTGFLPSPARAVLKLPKAQERFYTLARTLNQAGYESSFIYGGESHFDNMKGFFLANGFNTVIDQTDFSEPEFVGTWGVSDEDLFNQALAYLTEPSEQPKFSVIFSSSNHVPFEFPDHKIELYDADKNTVNNAVKYADYALGQFLNQLEQTGLLQSSLVLVVADHDARVTGADWVPIEHFHIPGFIIGAGIEPTLDDTLASQIDLAPTLLSLLGLELPHPMIGIDLSQLPIHKRGRAIMQYGDYQAYMTDDNMVVLRPEESALTFVKQGSDWVPSKPSEINDIALAHASFASWAYDHHRYRLP